MKNQQINKSKSKLLLTISFLLITLFNVGCQGYIEKNESKKDVVKQNTTISTNSENEIKQ